MRSFLVMAMFAASFAGANTSSLDEGREPELPVGDSATLEIDVAVDTLPLHGDTGVDLLNGSGSMRIVDQDADVLVAESHSGGVVRDEVHSMAAPAD